MNLNSLITLGHNDLIKKLGIRRPKTKTVKKKTKYP
jgi:hypothetical protein